MQLEGVGLRFGRLEVLRDISFQVHRGETVAVIGESGCGKTVLLKVIIDLLRPTAGRVTFDGVHLAEQTGPQARMVENQQPPDGLLVALPSVVDQDTCVAVVGHFPSGLPSKPATLPPGAGSRAWK